MPHYKNGHSCFSVTLLNDTEECYKDGWQVGMWADRCAKCACAKCVCVCVY